MQQENIYLPDSQTPPPLIACIGGQLVLPPPLSSGRWGSGEGKSPTNNYPVSDFTHEGKFRKFHTHSCRKAPTEFGFSTWSFTRFAHLLSFASLFYLDIEFILDNCNVTRSITLLHFWKNRMKKFIVKHSLDQSSVQEPVVNIDFGKNNRRGSSGLVLDTKHFAHWTITVWLALRGDEGKGRN